MQTSNDIEANKNDTEQFLTIFLKMSQFSVPRGRDRSYRPLLNRPQNNARQSLLRNPQLGPNSQCQPSRNVNPNRGGNQPAWTSHSGDNSYDELYQDEVYDSNYENYDQSYVEAEDNSYTEHGYEETNYEYSTETYQENYDQYAEYEDNVQYEETQYTDTYYDDSYMDNEQTLYEQEEVNYEGYDNESLQGYHDRNWNNSASIGRPPDRGRGGTWRGAKDSFSSDWGRGDMTSDRGRGVSNLDRGRGGSSSERGRGGSKSDRGRGGSSSDRGRGGFSSDRGRGGFSSDRGRGSFNSDRGRGGISSDRGRGGFGSDTGRGGSSSDRGRGGFSSDTDKGGSSSDRGRGGFSSDRGRGSFNSDRGRGGISSDWGRGGCSSDTGRGGSSSDRGRGGFSSVRGSGGFGSDTGRGGSSLDRGRGGSSSDRGRGGFSSDRGKGGSSSDMERGGISLDRGKGGYSSDTGRGGSSSDRGRGGFSSDRGRSDTSSDRGNGGSTSDRGRGGFSSDRGRDVIISDRGRGGMSSYRGRSDSSSERGRGGSNSDRGRGGMSSDTMNQRLYSVNEKSGSILEENDGFDGEYRTTDPTNIDIYNNAGDKSQSHGNVEMTISGEDNTLFLSDDCGGEVILMTDEQDDDDINKAAEQVHTSINVDKSNTDIDKLKTRVDESTGGQFGINKSSKDSHKTLIPMKSGDKPRNINTEENVDSDSSEEDTGYCKYCKISFTSAQAYHNHTRGFRHTQLVMEAKKGNKDSIKEEIASTSDNIENQNELVTANTPVNAEKQKKLVDVDSDSSEEDTSYCKYCETSFASAKAYHNHTRGFRHTQLVMEAEAKKGNKHFQKEEVDASALVVNIPKPAEVNLQETGQSLRQKLENKDLKPDDIGKGINDDFQCALCDIKCTGASTFKAHIEGKQHKSKLEMMKMGVPPKKKKTQGETIVIDTNERESKLARVLASEVSPIIGLEYVTEFQRQDPTTASKFVCNLCESKCDIAAIKPHLVGLKHRLKYFEVKEKEVYQAFLSFNSKKKKSELASSIEQYAQDVERREGRSKIKVKIEVDTGDDTGLKEEMLKRSLEISKMVKGLASETEEESSKHSSTKSDEHYEPPTKKSRPEPHFKSEAGMFNRDDHMRDRRDQRDMYHDSQRDMYHDSQRDMYHDSQRDMYHEPHGVPRPRRPVEVRDPYYRDRYHHPVHPPPPPPPEHYDDFRATYRYEFDPYRMDDAMYERRMFEERRRLDDLMLERHRLDDPFAERRRIDDIMERRRYLAELESDRFNDILERKRKLQYEDVDYLRLQRFADRDKGTRLRGMSEEERVRLDSVLSRRRAIEESTKQSPLEHMPDNRLSTETILSSSSQHILSSSSSQNISEIPGVDRLDAATKQALLVKVLNEEFSKHADVGAHEIVSKLSISMVALGADSQMASQLSETLAQAIVKHRNKSNPPQVPTFRPELPPVVEQSIPETNIPGLGTSLSSENVPSFLRSSNIQPLPDANNSQNQLNQMLPGQQSTAIFSDTQKHELQSILAKIGMLPSSSHSTVSQSEKSPQTWTSTPSEYQQWTGTPPQSQQWTTMPSQSLSQPQQWTDSQSQPQQWTGSSSQPQQLTGSSSQPQQWTGASPQPQQMTGSHSQSQQWTGATFQSQQWTSAPPQPQQLTGSSPQQWTGAPPQPQQLTGSSPQQWTGASPQPTQWTGESPQPQQWTSASSQLEQWTGSHSQSQQWTGPHSQSQQWTGSQSQTLQWSGSMHTSTNTVNSATTQLVPRPPNHSAASQPGPTPTNQPQQTTRYQQSGLSYSSHSATPQWTGTSPTQTTVTQSTIQRQQVHTSTHKSQSQYQQSGSHSGQSVSEQSGSHSQQSVSVAPSSVRQGQQSGANNSQPSKSQPSLSSQHKKEILKVIPGTVVTQNLLDSIRQQTELLKEKIKSSLSNSGNKTVANTSVHSKQPTDISTSLTQTSTSQNSSPSPYSTQYYKQNYQAPPPNSAPPTSANESTSNPHSTKGGGQLSDHNVPARRSLLNTPPPPHNAPSSAPRPNAPAHPPYTNRPPPPRNAPPRQPPLPNQQQEYQTNNLPPFRRKR
ncbi:SWI/SNF-related matrix-associated actin-dependent regulator of chromatin subfamily A-like protein 1 [Mactra antiquata]